MSTGGLWGGPWVVVVAVAAYLLVGIVLLRLFRQRRAHGRLLILFVLLFALVRLLTEATRGDHAGRGLGGLSPVQVVLLAGLLLAALGLWRARLVDALLQWRSVDPRDAEVPLLATVETSSLRHLLFVAGGSILGLPLVLFPMIFAVLLCLDLRLPPAAVAPGPLLSTDWLKRNNSVCMLSK